MRSFEKLAVANGHELVIVKDPGVPKKETEYFDISSWNGSAAIKEDKREALGDRVTVLTVADLLGEAVHRIHSNRSVSYLFNME